MKKHASILKPKFDAVLNVLDEELTGSGIAEWSRPNGGYFISIDTLAGCAQDVIRKAAEAGVKLTPAGATFPYGNDPADRNIRIAPSFPSAADAGSGHHYGFPAAGDLVAGQDGFLDYRVSTRSYLKISNSSWKTEEISSKGAL